MYVHLAGREPVRLSGRAAVVMLGGPRRLGVLFDADQYDYEDRYDVNMRTVNELVASGLFDGDQFTALGRQVAAVLAAEVPVGA